MTHQTRLSAFKVLKKVTWITLVVPEIDIGSPAGFCHLMAREKINLVFFVCGRQDQGWDLNIAVDSSDSQHVTDLIESHFAETTCHSAESCILSLFPHRSDPSVAGSLFHVFEMTGIEPEALACSNSAISVVLREEAVDIASTALFEPFQFSAYRTPADWKLAQKGKEKLFKEVVASYQEIRPKVYNLEWREDQKLFRLELNNRDLGLMGNAFIGFARQGFNFSFLSSSLSMEQKLSDLFLCVPEYDQKRHPDVIKESLPEAIINESAHVAVFSMNGPHFGDRYSIASELLLAFDRANVELLALGCAIASISGVVPAYQIDLATDAIKGCFEVPSVIKKIGKTT